MLQHNQIKLIGPNSNQKSQIRPIVTRLSTLIFHFSVVSVTLQLVRRLLILRPAAAQSSQIAVATASRLATVQCGKVPTVAL
ncbi:hypothetical protein H5410_057982 [Solanum commersonii]|uniref:Uncharacterized protein n=1 Tax=Solanum commersonii TaxID=4109 RepID=A0A9J5WS90_SOLCO|nr:hypothetical protein H5410_057982 [Solanum commersonii]